MTRWATSHNLSQCWLIQNLTIRIKLQWNTLFNVSASIWPSDAIWQDGYIWILAQASWGRQVIIWTNVDGTLERYSGINLRVIKWLPKLLVYRISFKITFENHGLISREAMQWANVLLILVLGVPLLSIYDRCQQFGFLGHQGHMK